METRGCYEDFDKIIKDPFDTFAPQPWLVYFYKNIKKIQVSWTQSPQTWEEGTFYESSSNVCASNGGGAKGANGARACNNNNNKPSKRTIGAKDQIFWDTAKLNQQAAEASQEKNQAIKLAAITQTRAMTQSMLENAQAKPKNLSRT